MPSWPTGVQTTTVTFGKGITVDGNVTSATLTVTPVFNGTKAVKWGADSTPLLPFVITATANAGAYGSVQLPVVDQAGWKDDGQHDYSLWAYKLEELPKYGTTVGVVRTKYVQPLTGQTSIDFDDIPDGSVGLPASAPVVPVSSVAGFTGAVTVDELAQAGIGGATDAGVNAILTNPTSASATSLAATYATLAQALLAWTLAQAFTVTSATRDANEAITTAAVVWPDGATGTFTTDTVSAAFPGAIDAYHVTHVLGGTTKTVTQTAVTRDAGGAVTAQPALVVA